MTCIRQQVRKYGERHVGKYFNLPGGLAVEVRRHGIDEAIQHGSRPDKLKAFTAIPKLLETGQVVYAGVNPKNQRGRLVVTSHRVEISGKMFAVSAGFRKDPNGRLFHDHELIDVSRVGGLSSQPGEGLVPTTSRTYTDTA